MALAALLRGEKNDLPYPSEWLRNGGESNLSFSFSWRSRQYDFFCHREKLSTNYQGKAQGKKVFLFNGRATSRVKTDGSFPLFFRKKERRLHAWACAAYACKLHLSKNAHQRFPKVFSEEMSHTRKKLGR